MKNAIILIFCFLTVFTLAFKLGEDTRQNEIERRALELPEKDDFSNIDIEHILFNLPQE